MTTGCIFYKPPLTLDELNSRLQACIDQHSFAPLKLVQATEGQDKVTLTELFEAIRYPLESFKDGADSTKITELKRKLITLFPFKENVAVHRAVNEALNLFSAPANPAIDEEFQAFFAPYLIERQAGMKDLYCQAMNEALSHLRNGYLRLF
jgi:hypothetical protein